MSNNNLKAMVMMFFVGMTSWSKRKNAEQHDEEGYAIDRNGLRELVIKPLKGIAPRSKIFMAGTSAELFGVTIGGTGVFIASPTGEDYEGVPEFTVEAFPFEASMSEKFHFVQEQHKKSLTGEFINCFQNLIRAINNLATCLLHNQLNAKLRFDLKS